MSPGEVFWVELARGRGHEQHGRRPVIVVQSVEAGLSTVLCVPTSTSAVLSSWRVEVEIEGTSTTALPEQVRALDAGRLTQRAGRISSDELRDVLAQIRSLLPLV